jgi:hypothetical protein
MAGAQRRRGSSIATAGIRCSASVNEATIRPERHAREVTCPLARQLRVGTVDEAAVAAVPERVDLLHARVAAAGVEDVDEVPGH